MKTPLVSILLPTYKNAPYIETAISSVLRQDFADWELLIIDDGLYETPLHIVESLKSGDSHIVYIKNERNLGIQKSLNKGILESRGRYIARIDDDDEWIDVNKLTKQIVFLENNPEYVLVGTNAIIKDEKGKNLGTYKLPLDDESIRRRILSKNCFLHPSIVARKDAIQSVGGYDESEGVRHIEDYALWLKLGLSGKFINMDFTGVGIMVHPQSLTSSNRLVQVRNMRRLITQYKKSYPGFMSAMSLLYIRTIGFAFLSYIPIPDKLLYKIQKIYKNF